MVSSPLSPSQSFFAPSPTRAGGASRGSSELSAAVGKGPDFASHFAPAGQEVRSGAQKPRVSQSGSETPTAKTNKQGAETSSSEQLESGSEAKPGSKASERTGGSAHDEQSVEPQESETQSSTGDQTEQSEEEAESSGTADTQSTVLNPDSAATKREAGASAQVSSTDAEESGSQQKPIRGIGKDRAEGSAASTTSSAKQHDGQTIDGSLRAADEKQAAPAVPAKPMTRTNAESGTAEQSTERSSSVERDSGAEQASDSDSEQRSGDRRENAEGRSDSKQTPTTAENAPAQTSSTAEKPSFLSAGREEQVERSDQQTRSNEAAPIRTNANGAETIGAIKLDPASIGERGASQIGAERSAMQARSEPESPTAQSVARGVSAVLRQGGGSLTMKLSPASLGDIRIEMNMHAGKVSVQFDVGSVAAYEAIKGQLTELRHSLEQRGMTVERVETHISPAIARSAQSESGSNQRSGDQPGQGDGQNRHDAADGQSRGRAGSNHKDDGFSSDRESGLAGGGFAEEFETTLNIGLDAVA